MSDLKVSLISFLKITYTLFPPYELIPGAQTQRGLGEFLARLVIWAL
jgi:hypothetical protein